MQSVLLLTIHLNIFDNFFLSLPSTSPIVMGSLSLPITTMNNEDSKSRQVFEEKEQFVGWKVDFSSELGDIRIKIRINMS